MTNMGTNNDIRIIPLGKFSVEQRMSDRRFNATALLRQWNECNSDTKSLGKFMEDEKKFAEEFAGDACASVPIQENGETWMGELMFRNFLCYLSPKIAMVDFHVDKKYVREEFPAHLTPHRAGQLT